MSLNFMLYRDYRQGCWPQDSPTFRRREQGLCCIPSGVWRALTSSRPEVCPLTSLKGIDADAADAVCANVVQLC